MSRRPPGRRPPRCAPLRLALFAAAALLAGCGGGTASERFPNAPVVVISIDTLRSDHLPIYGYSRVETPAISALAARGVVFERAFSQIPLTLPSHLSILTGQLPGVHGVRDNLGYRIKTAEHPFLPRLLHAAGYRSGAAVSAFVLRAETGIAEGFDFYEAGVELRANESIGQSQRPCGETLAAARPWLAGVAAQPFFFLYHLYEPHTPYAAPADLRSRFANPYDAEIAAADRCVADLLAELATLGVEKRALVVLLSDHGEGLGEHGEQEHGILLYREDLQVPLVVRLPGDRRAGARVATPVELVDVLPTILDLVGVAAPAGLAGRSLFAGPLAADRALYAETFYPRLHLGWSELTSVVRGDRHAILGPDPELYDLARDPGELANLRDSERRTFAELRDLDHAARRPLNAPMAEDSETVAKLTALGYLGGGAGLAGDQALPDPKAKIPTLAGYNDLLGAVSAQDFTRAVGLATKLCAENPLMADAWDLLGLSQARLGRHAEALAAYQKAMELTGGTPHLATAIANLYVELGKLDDAEKHARLALDGSPAAAHSILASVALGRKDYARAESEVEAALAAGGSKAGPLILLAQALCDQGKLDAALAATDRAIAALGPEQPKYSGLYLVRGDILGRLGRFADAGAAFEREIDQFPWDPKPYVKLAALLAAAERGDDATAVLKALLARNPASPSAFVEAVKALRVLGRPGDAAQVLAEARRRFAGARELAGL
jgi:arylsulfatase A-like enzyme/tetratricopeptide (TPR) repeat protein